MNPLAYPLLADENIHPDVVGGLRSRGHDIRTAIEEGVGGKADAAVLERGATTGRVVLTHDRDFGELAISQGARYVGIVYLRPGHISSAWVLEIVDAIRARAPDVTSPFLVVAVRRGDRIRMRVRSGVGG